MYFTGIHRDALSRYDMTEEWNFLQPKVTLAEFSIKLMFSKTLKNYVKMMIMFFLSLGVDQDIINEDHDELI